MGFFINAFCLLVLTLYFKSSSFLEIIEEVYLFVESHYERARDYEKIDDFKESAIRAGFELLCTAGFCALLALWTWTNLPLKHHSRKDLEGERDSALGLIQRLEARNSELEAESKKYLKDRNTYRNDYAAKATENIKLENKLAELQLQSADHADIQLRLHQSEEECRDLERSLERLRRIRHDEESELIALSSNDKRSRREIKQLKVSLGSKTEAMGGYKARIAELEEEVKEANIQKRAELTRLENTRDQASQNAAIEASAAKTRIAELEEEVKGVNIQKRAELTRLENMRDQASQNAAIEASAAKIRIAELEEEVKEVNIQKRAELTRLENMRDQASQNAAIEASAAKTRIAELEEEVKEVSIQKQAELTRLENMRDQASQNAAIEASAAKTRIAELEAEVSEAKEALQKGIELTRLENTTDQANQNAAFETEINDLKLTLEGADEDLAREIVRLEAAIALWNAERTSLQDQQAHSQHLLQERDAEIESINARHLAERESQRYWRWIGGLFSGGKPNS
ncbi:hypothetical protein MMC29_004645 [Sticta canariensis]|nr:hypothetical protein [Sticta canariensis]